MVGRGLRCISSLSLGEECRVLKGIMFPWGATTGSECCFLIFCLHPPAASSKQGALLSRVPRPCCCGRALVSKQIQTWRVQKESSKNTKIKTLMTFTFWEELKAIVSQLSWHAIFTKGKVIELWNTVIPFKKNYKIVCKQRKNDFTSTPRAPVTHFCSCWANLARQLRNCAHFWNKRKTERAREFVQKHKGS